MTRKLFRIFLIFTLIAVVARWPQPTGIQAELPERKVASTPVYPDLDMRAELKAVLSSRWPFISSMVTNPLVTVIDLSLPSTVPRLWTFNPHTGALLFHSLVAHGRQSGENLAVQFSNQPQSHQSSLGFYLTGQAYTGAHGLSLRLIGLETGINDKAFERAIVVHGADYVSEEFIAKYGRLGRSHGCPALPNDIVKEFIHAAAEGSLLFVYHPEYVRHLALNDPITHNASAGL